MTNEGCAVCGTEDVGRFDPDQSLDICTDCLHAGAEGVDFRMTIRTNEDRADKGAELVSRVHMDVDEITRVSDALSYIRHYCDREGLDWWEVVERANRSYAGDAEDGPYARCRYDSCERCGDPARPDHVCVGDGSAPLA